MRVRVLPVLLLLAPLLLPAASADYDEGAGDAPNACEAALEVQPGTITGRNVGRYDDDAYKVAVPAGKVAYVTYQVLEGDTWNSAYLHETTCGYVTSVWSGQTTAFQPSLGYVIIKVYGGYWGGSSYSVHVTFADAPPQNDGGLGVDAGNIWDHATQVAPGRIAGRTLYAAGDHADWFRIEAAPDQFLALRAESGSFYLLDAYGRSLGSLNGYPEYATTASLVPPGGALLVGTASGSYAVEVLGLTRTDLAVTGLTAEPLPLGTEAAPLPASPQREVTVTVANQGQGDSHQARLLVYTSAEGSTVPQRVLHDRPLALLKGESATIRILWDTLGQVGETRLHAVVTNAHDLDARDDAASLRTSVLVGGLATGADLLNPRVIAGGSTVGADYDADRHGADATVAPVSGLGVGAGLWVDGAGRVRATAGGCALLCVGV